VGALSLTWKLAHTLRVWFPGASLTVPGVQTFEYLQKALGFTASSVYGGSQTHTSGDL
jgi:hypothetical protein